MSNDDCEQGGRSGKNSCQPEAMRVSLHEIRMKGRGMRVMLVNPSNAPELMATRLRWEWNVKEDDQYPNAESPKSDTQCYQDEWPNLLQVDLDPQIGCTLSEVTQCQEGRPLP